MKAMHNTGKPESDICDSITEDEIYERLMAAIFDQRLAPGMKLGEDRLATIFGVSRARIRRVLPRLAHEHVVQIEPNRGAFVAEPSIRQAREVFDARRLIEPAIVRRLATAPGKEVLVQKLRQHVALEEQARAQNDVRSVVRLSGEFHIVLAQSAGNSMLARTIRELATLTCLIIALYDRPLASHCLAHEHAALIGALEAGDGAKAQALMLDHLSHVEAGLKLTREEVTYDLAAALL